MKTVIFDLGGVLVDWNPRYLYRTIFNGDETKVDWFLTQICTPEWNEQHDLGISFDENAARLIAKFPENAAEIRAYKDRWAEMFGGPIHESVEILSAVKKQKRNVYALTNWSAETFPRAEKMFPFFSWFDGVVVSGRVKMIKPDPKIFEHLLEAYSLNPMDSLFIDDNQKNVEMARKLGFHSVHFQNPKKLREELEKFKIIELVV